MLVPCGTVRAEIQRALLGLVACRHISTGSKQSLVLVLMQWGKVGLPDTCLLCSNLSWHKSQFAEVLLLLLDDHCTQRHEAVSIPKHRRRLSKICASCRHMKTLKGSASFLQQLLASACTRAFQSQEDPEALARHAGCPCDKLRAML